MKQGLSILLLCLLVYNAIGYYLYFEYRQTQARVQLRQQLQTRNVFLTQQEADQKVQQGKWVLFSIPITLYHQSDRAVEPTEGEFLFQNKVYEKAMRSIRNDTLYVYCVNNQVQEQVRSDLSAHVKTHLLDSQTPQKDKAQKATKLSLVQEYLPVEKHALLLPSFVVVETHGFQTSFSLVARPWDTPFYPPQQA